MHVVLKRVSNIEKTKQSKGYSGLNCFCLVITIAREERAQQQDTTDSISVGTVNTDNDDTTDNEDVLINF